MSFIATDPQSHKGKTDIWLTPLDLLKRIGEFDLDPCGFQGHQTARKIICLPEDGLEKEWSGKVWLNPPYSEAGAWLSKLSKHGFGAALLFARTGSNWIQPYIKKADSVFLIRGRVSFLKPDKTKMHNAGADSMILCFGCEVVDKTLGIELKPDKEEKPSHETVYSSPDAKGELFEWSKDNFPGATHKAKLTGVEKIEDKFYEDLLSGVSSFVRGKPDAQKSETEP